LGTRLSFDVVAGTPPQSTPDEEQTLCHRVFLHTPFPAGDFWRTLPVKKYLIEGLLSSDLIGFHTDEYKQDFIDTCASNL
jgi:trehalose-6-phosphate synthase